MSQASRMRDETADARRWDRMRETIERRFTLAKQRMDASRPDDTAAIGVYLR
jgi:hypothetical protein